VVQWRDRYSRKSPIKIICKNSIQLQQCVYTVYTNTLKDFITFSFSLYKKKKNTFTQTYFFKRFFLVENPLSLKNCV